MTKATAALTHIRQLCGLGLGSEAIMPALLRSVRRLVRAESAAFFWVDAEGEMSNLYAERMLPPETMRRYFERYYASPEHAFTRRLKDRTAAGQFVLETSADAAVQATRFFEEIQRPLDAYRLLHGIVQDGDRLLGQLSLYRGERAPRFGGADKQAVASVTQYLRQSFASTAKRRTTTADAFRPSDEEALVIASTEGEIATASYRAYALLAHASGEPINRNTITGSVDRASRDLLRKLAGKLQESGQSDGVPSLLVENSWGRYRLRAYALSRFEMGVVIQRQEHLLVRIVDAMRELPLSAQQREVALLLAQGKTNGEIGRSLGVTLNTASYHVKQLFDKLDAHDRSEAIARILDGHTARV